MSEITDSLFYEIVNMTIERKEALLVENRMRTDFKEILEREPYSEEYRGYIAFLAKNSPSRRMNYNKLEQFLEQYEWLIENKILTISEPKTPQRLVISPKEKKRT